MLIVLVIKMTAHFFKPQFYKPQSDNQAPKIRGFFIGYLKNGLVTKNLGNRYYLGNLETLVNKGRLLGYRSYRFFRIFFYGGFGYCDGLAVGVEWYA